MQPNFDQTLHAPAIVQIIQDVSVIRANMFDHPILPPEIVCKIFKYVITGPCIAAKKQLRRTLKYAVDDFGEINLECSGDFINPASNHPEERFYCISYHGQKLIAKAYVMRNKTIKIDVPDDIFVRIASKYYRKDIQHVCNNINF